MKKVKMSESEALELAIRLTGAIEMDSGWYEEADAATKKLKQMKAKLDKPPITVKRRKEKGRELQQAIRSDLIRVFGIDEKDILSTPGGVTGCDIYLAQAARKKFPFGVECKNQEAVRVWDAWEQASTNADSEGLNPMLIMHRNNSKKLCVIDWELFKKMVRGKEKC